MRSLTIRTLLILPGLGLLAYACQSGPHAILALPAAAILLLAARRAFKPTRVNLDDTLLTWPDTTPWTVRDALRGTEVKGKTGSGKSSGAIDNLLAAIAAHPRSCIVAVTMKPEEKDDIIFRLRKARKKYKLVDASGTYRCNFLDDERASGADISELTQFATVLGEGLKIKDGNKEHPFYDSFDRRTLYNSIAMLSLAGELSMPNLQTFIVGATIPRSKDPDESERLLARWKLGYHYAVYKKAESAKKNRVQQNDWAVAKPFFGVEWQNMDERTRANGLAGVMNLFQSANTGLAREITATTTNVSPRDLDDGWSIILDFPYSIWADTGRYIAGGMLWKIQRHILRRKWDGRYFCILLRDEYQESRTDFDAPFLAQCRSHGASMICATQTVAAEYAMDTHGHHKSDMLMANFGTSIYHQADPATEEVALKKLGQRREMFLTPTTGGNHDTYDVLMGNAQPSVSVSYQWQPVLHAGCLDGLRTGGNHRCVDALVIQGSLFRNQQRHQFVTFKQRRK